MDLFSWSTWSVPLLSVGLAALVVVPCALARPLWDNYQHRRRQLDWERQAQAARLSPLEGALAELSAWDGYLPAWVVANANEDR